MGIFSRWVKAIKAAFRIIFRDDSDGQAGGGGSVDDGGREEVGGGAPRIKDE